MAELQRLIGDQARAAAEAFANPFVPACQHCGRFRAEPGHPFCVRCQRNFGQQPAESATRSSCTHPAPEVVTNADREPVRLLCACGREWRVLPAEWKVRRVDGAEASS